MTRDEIIRMAREAGIIDRSPFIGVRPAMMNALGNFFALAYEEGAKAEREQCAKVCDDRAMANENAANKCDDKDDISSLRSAAWQMTVCAKAIRARGK